MQAVNTLAFNMQAARAFNAQTFSAQGLPALGPLQCWRRCQRHSRRLEERLLAFLLPEQRRRSFPAEQRFSGSQPIRATTPPRLEKQLPALIRLEWRRRSSLGKQQFQLQGLFSASSRTQHHFCLACASLSQSLLSIRSLAVLKSPTVDVIPGLFAGALPHSAFIPLFASFLFLSISSFPGCSEYLTSFRHWATLEHSSSP